MKAKSYMIILLLSSFALSSKAQGFLGGIFSQNSTQEQYLIQQIAALQVYDQYVKSGNNINKDGTGAIDNIKSSDFNLHKGHFDSLKIVSAKVKSYSKVAATAQLQKNIISSHSQAYPLLANGGQLSAGELGAYASIYNGILDQSGKALEQLQLVITDGRLQMTDDERIAAIDKIYTAMQAAYKQTRQLNDRALSLAAQRSRESKDRNSLKTLYGQQ